MGGTLEGHRGQTVGRRATAEETEGRGVDKAAIDPFINADRFVYGF